MNYCNYCGVELEITMSSCPLCGLKAGEVPQKVHEEKSQKPSYRDRIATEIAELTQHQKRKLIREFVGIILGCGIIITLIINLMTEGKISWANYVIVASIIAYANIMLLTSLVKRPLILVSSSLFSVVVLLALLDLLNFGVAWGIKLGIPLVGSLYLLSFVLFLINRYANQRGFNILAFAFLLIAVFLICTEASISQYRFGEIVLTWSIIAGTSLLPISAILFYIHYRLKKGVDLKRFFHI